jgi:hypothetical protein
LKNPALSDASVQYEIAKCASSQSYKNSQGNLLISKGIVLKKFLSKQMDKNQEVRKRKKRAKRN